MYLCGQRGLPQVLIPICRARGLAERSDRRDDLRHGQEVDDKGASGGTSEGIEQQSRGSLGG